MLTTQQSIQTLVQTQTDLIAKLQQELSNDWQLRSKLPNKKLKKLILLCQALKYLAKANEST